MQFSISDNHKPPVVRNRIYNKINTHHTLYTKVSVFLSYMELYVVEEIKIYVLGLLWCVSISPASNMLLFLCAIYNIFIEKYINFSGVDGVLGMYAKKK